MIRTHSPLNPADHAALMAIRASGRVGMSSDQIRDILGLPSDHASEYFAKRARDRGHPVRAIRVAPTERGHAYRYVVDGAPTAAASSPHPSVIRLVSGEIGMGGTPGTPVSVAFVSFLDAPPRARDGEG